MAIARTYHRVSTYVRTHGVIDSGTEFVRRLARRARMGDLPPAVHVEISSVCNLNCEYCVLDQGLQGDRIMSEATFAAVLPYLKGARRVDVSGLAEPLMNTRWRAMLLDIRAVAPRAHIAMCSNATLLTREKSIALVAAGLDELAFSLDGVDAEFVDRVRHGGSLHQMLDNILALQAVKKEEGSSRPELSATFVLQRTNAPQLPEVIRLAAELGVGSVNVNGLEPYTPELVGEPVWTDGARGEYLPEILARADELATANNVILRLPSMRPRRPVCPQIQRPIVLADGSVVPCSVLAYERHSLLTVDATGVVMEGDRMTPRLAFGTIKERSLKDIWRSHAYRRFRRRVASGDFPEPCDTCLLKHGVICPVPALSVSECLATV